jgi:hypothetical protein
MKYTFMMEQLTIGDFLALVDASKTNNMHAFILIAHRYTVDGMLDLPFHEMKNAIEQFTQAFTAFVHQTGTPTSPDVQRILRQAIGEEQE